MTRGPYELPPGRNMPVVSTYAPNTVTQLSRTPRILNNLPASVAVRGAENLLLQCAELLHLLARRAHSLFIILPIGIFFRRNSNIIVVGSQISTSFLYSAVYYLLVYNPSRPCLTPERRFHLNQTRSLSYSYISPNQTCLPYILTFNPAPQPPKFPTFNLTWYQVPGTRFHAKKGQKPKKRYTYAF